MDSSNGHHPEEQIPLVVNVYAETARGDRPEEILEFERATDPYTNMLPGISSIRAAETVGRGVQVGRRGNGLILAVSVFMLLALLLPLIFAVISQVSHH